MFLRSLAAHLPRSAQDRLRLWKCEWQLAAGRFVSKEPEFALLPDLVRPGDWVLDVGANVGRYTLRLADLVGPEGRVIAFEPVLETAAILGELAGRAGHRNITLLNLAVSDSPGVLRFSVPVGADGLRNFEQARVQAGSHPNDSLDGRAAGKRREALDVVVSAALDDFCFPHRIALIKIDVEQHEVAVLRGMRKLLAADRPILIIEAHEGVYREFLMEHGYQMRQRAPGSPNFVFLPPAG